MSTASLWAPGTAGGLLATPGGSGAVSVGTQFQVSGYGGLTGIWFWSPLLAACLPSACCLYDMTTGQVVPGTLKTSPAWSGAAGSGWVKTSFSGAVVLQPGRTYMVTVYGNSGSAVAGWYGAALGYWAAGGAGVAGLITAILDAPAVSQYAHSAYTLAAGLQLPATATTTCFFADVEVTYGAVVTAGSALTARPSLAASSRKTSPGAVALTANAAIGAWGTRGQPGRALLAASPVLGAGAVLSRTGRAALAAHASAGAAGVPARAGGAFLSAQATWDATGTRAVAAAAVFSASATWDASATVTGQARVQLTAFPQLNVQAQASILTRLDLTALAAISAAAFVSVQAAGRFRASPGLTATMPQGAWGVAAPHFSAITFGAQLQSTTAPLSAQPKLTVAGTSGRAGRATLAAPGTGNAAALVVAESEAVLQAAAGIVVQAGTSTLGSLWLNYQSLRSTAQDLWQQWKMMKAIARTDGTAGQLYGQAYEAEYAADQAYESYLAELRKTGPGSVPAPPEGWAGRN